MKGSNLSDPHRRNSSNERSSTKKSRWLNAKANRYNPRGTMALIWVKFAAELLD